MSEEKTDAEEILAEFRHSHGEPTESKPLTTQTVVQKPEPAPESGAEPKQKHDAPQRSHSHDRNVIFVGTKPIMTYVTATLTQLASQPIVTIKARGKLITQAVDVSQMIVKRMNTVGYTISGIRISSDSLTSQDGKKRKVSTIEIDVSNK